jgi:O-antigen ligase
VEWPEAILPRSRLPRSALNMLPFVATSGVPMDTLPEQARGVERRETLLRFFLGLFLVSSIALTLNRSTEGDIPIRVLRWGSLACANVLAFGHLLQSPWSRQGAAWVLSSLYAAGTLVYSIDIPATVLRSISFLALTLGAFIGGSICYQERTASPHRLPDRMGTTLAIFAIPSAIAWILGAPEFFFHQAHLLRGVFVHANTLGAFGAIWFVVSVGAYDSRLCRHRSLVLIGIVAMALCLIGSKCRAGLGATIISVLLYILVTRKLNRVFVGAILAGTILLTTVVMSPYAADLAVEGAGSFVFKGDATDPLSSRRDVWDAGWNNFYASPWWGYGFGTSVGEETKEWKFVGLGAREKGNAFLAMLEEVGVLGALIMWFPLVLCIANVFRLKRLNICFSGISGVQTAEARLAAAFWAGAMGGLVDNLAEATLWSAGSPHGGMLLFLAGASEGLLIRTEARR